MQPATRPAVPPRAALLAALALATLSPAHGSAHDLDLDRLVIRSAREALRGELTLDPALTRGDDASPTTDHGARLLQLLDERLTLEVDGRRLEVTLAIKELWVAGGAVPGDLVTLESPLPNGARVLRVRSEPPLLPLAVSVQRPGTTSRVSTHSWLLTDERASPPFPLDAHADPTRWKLGGSDQFSIGVDAGVAARRPSAPGRSSGAPRSGATSSDSRGSDAPERERPFGSLDLAARFVGLGFRHVLPLGLDHVAFVAGLALRAPVVARQLLVAVSLFTLAHTATLLLGGLGLVRVPSGVVESLIGASVLVVGVEGLRRPPQVTTKRSRVHYAIVFGFGLVHGLGFAGALRELWLDRQSLVIGLAAFNVGVELGQLVVIALVASLLTLVARLGASAEHVHVRLIFPGSLAIAIAGAFLVVERAPALFAP